MKNMPSIYQCPVCGEKLEQVNKSFVCGKNHSYDISREGYVNLLLANQKNSRNPGDSAFMAESRKSFLERGYFDPLSDEVNKTILALVKGPAAGDSVVVNILDVGCGVGTYSGRLKKFLDGEGFEERVNLFGIDISKPSIQKAAKGCGGVHFAIGSNFHLPYLDESLDVIFSIFSPFDSLELLRVLSPGGKILLVRPGTNHLKELGALIYDRFELQGNPADLSAGEDFLLVEKHNLGYEIHIKSNEDVMSLVSMTPYYWHLNAENKALLAGLSDLTVSADFAISLFQRPF
jgi:23S rRNA (guanine745-N1)-methyltransferase